MRRRALLDGLAAPACGGARFLRSHVLSPALQVFPPTGTAGGASAAPACGAPYVPGAALATPFTPKFTPPILVRANIIDVV